MNVIQNSRPPVASLYVGDLATDVSEAILYEKFSQIGPILSIRICRDLVSRRSLGYGYVNFQNATDAERAIDTLNFDNIKGRPCRIMWSERDPSRRRTGSSNIFIKNLDKTVDNKALYDTFSTFGTILSCKVATDENSESKGFGFVHYETEGAAQSAIDQVNGMSILDKKVFVGKFMTKKERKEKYGQIMQRFTNVYVKNFGDELDDQKLYELFQPFGKITSYIVMKDPNNVSKGFGFVAFDSPEIAEQAARSLNGYKLNNGSELYVGRAQKKAERRTELKQQYEQLKKEKLKLYQGVNLYVKNLDDSIDDEQLREHFSSFGTITSAKVMRDEKGNSKGFGFVCFSSADEATKAVTDMNNKLVNTKPLYVALAMRKEERRIYLNNTFTQRMSIRMQTGPVPTGQVFPQPSQIMYHIPGQRFVPAAAAPFAPITRTRMPMPHMRPMYHALTSVPVQQPQQRGGPRASGVRPMQARPNLPTLASGAGPNRPQQQQQAMVRSAQFSQQQSLPQTAVPGQQPAPQPPRPTKMMPGGRPMQAVSLHTILANMDHIDDEGLSRMPPGEQKEYFGDRLYRIIEKAYPDISIGKVTGMLLDMGVHDLAVIMGNAELLDNKIQEAISVLQVSMDQGAGAVQGGSAM